MRRFFTAVFGLAMAASATSSNAHFPYLVPLDEDAKVQVVFSDSLEPDKKVPIDRISKTTLFCLSDNGLRVPLPWTKGEHALLADLPKMSARIVGGVSDYGFHQSKHTQNKPVWLKYYPKAILGGVSATDDKRVRLGDHVRLEILPVVTGGVITYQAILDGKPLPNAEFGVLVPGEPNGKKVTADAKGLIAMGFDKPGRYGVRVAYIEPSRGQLNGQEYEEIRHYATLVLDFVPSTSR